MSSDPASVTGATGDPTSSRVEDDGVVVEKSATQQDDLVKVTVTLTSEREEPVSVRLRDDLPADVDADEVGFHPGYDPERWHLADEGAVVYEDVLDPAERRATVYGVKRGPDEDRSWLTAPMVIDVGSDGADDRAEGTAPSTRAPIEDAGVDTTAAPEGPVEDDRQQRERSASQPGGAADGAHAPGPSARPESPIEAVVTELRDRELTAFEQTVLREGLGLDTRNDLASRLRHVQSQVDDLVAYSESLEAFVGEHGDASVVIDDLEADQDALAAAVEGVEDRLDIVEDDVAALERAQEARTASLEDDVASLRALVSRLDRWRTNVSEAAAVGPIEE